MNRLPNRVLAVKRHHVQHTYTELESVSLSRHGYHLFLTHTTPLSPEAAPQNRLRPACDAAHVSTENVPMQPASQPACLAPSPDNLCCLPQLQRLAPHQPAPQVRQVLHLGVQLA